MTTPQLKTKYVFTITARIGEVTSAGEIGTGVRRIIPIIGGEVKGEKINGKVCPFGADFQIIRPNELIELEAKYAFETDDGAVVYVENKGLRFGPVDLLQKLKRGEPVDPKLIYFRTMPRFETGAPQYRWLMESLFIGSAARHADRVVIDVHQVLLRQRSEARSDRGFSPHLARAHAGHREGCRHPRRLVIQYSRGAND